jgi:fructose-bisphosphate aldolase class 1
MLKVTLPERAGLYDSLADHPNVLRVVALSGGYSTEDACARLTQNPKMIASFSRALTEGLNVKMSDAEFNTAEHQQDLRRLCRLNWNFPKFRGGFLGKKTPKQ